MDCAQAAARGCWLTGWQAGACHGYAMPFKYPSLWVQGPRWSPLDEPDRYFDVQPVCMHLDLAIAVLPVTCSADPVLQQAWTYDLHHSLSCLVKVCL